MKFELWQLSLPEAKYDSCDSAAEYSCLKQTKKLPATGRRVAVPAVQTRFKVSGPSHSPGHE